ncbi:MAG: efflux RND transporter periplasmic adaptor subunit [Gammaproteobacteria bacterium]
MSRRSKITLWIAALLLIAGASGLYVGGQDTAVRTPSYALATVERGELTLSVSASGTLSPLITVQVGSQLSGTLEKVYADFNDQVKKGDVIAQIEPSLFKAQVAQAQANFDSAVAAREKAWVAVQEAKRQLARAKRLRERKMMAESTVDAAQFGYDAAVVEHRVKKAVVAQGKAALDQARVNLAHTTIYAPIDGVVLSRDVDVGQTVAASLQAPTLFTIAQDLSRMQIDTSVDEAFIGMIREKQTVSFTVFAYPRQAFQGKVTQIRLNPRVESEVVLYNCVIHVDNSDLKLKPGMTATVTIEVGRRKDVLKIPNAALRYIPDLPPERLTALRNRLNLKNNEALIWTPAGDSVKPVKVSLGLTSDRETEISAEGLAEGTRVVIPGKRKAPVRKRKTGVRLF